MVNQAFLYDNHRHASVGYISSITLLVQLNTRNPTRSNISHRKSSGLRSCKRVAEHFISSDGSLKRVEQFTSNLPHSLQIIIYYFLLPIFEGEGLYKVPSNESDLKKRCRSPVIYQNYR